LAIIAFAVASRKKTDNPVPRTAVAPNAARVIRWIAAAKNFTEGPQTRIAEALGLPDSSLPNKWWRGKVGIGAASAVLLRDKFPDFADEIDEAIVADAALKRAAAERRARAPRAKAEGEGIAAALLDLFPVEERAEVAAAVTRVAAIGWKRVGPHLGDLLDKIEKLRDLTSGRG
jgi:hypothetical protein